MDVIEAMVSRGHGNDPTGPSRTSQVVAMPEIVHEVRDANTRRRLVSTDGDVVLGP
jgi:hypothetical protein